MSKQLHIERKNHNLILNNKAKEIEKLKNINGIKRLGRNKEIAEVKAKDAINEGVLLKKRAVETIGRGDPETVNTHTKSIIGDMKEISNTDLPIVKENYGDDELELIDRIQEFEI